MRPLAIWLDQHVLSGARSVILRDVTSIRNQFAADEFPDLMIVLQSWSNEYSTQDVNSLLAFAPLARVVVCYGAWCESDGRNQNIWPLSVRVPIWSAKSRIQREWQLIRFPGEQAPLPWSASREEIFTADHQPISIWNEPQSVLVDSPDPAYRQFLVEILIAEGHVVDAVSPTVILFDADPWSPSRAIDLQGLRDENPRADVLALTSLASPSDVAELQQLGVINMLHKLGFSH